ncbi:phage tail domain-containing protein [Streptomyces sp. TRM64462]|uniref:phage distal tail protein n=1 Tax=Streptomyces sp. TRM64462 TaxID=2741726 RepID=UPI001585E564|nr:phage tail domain-containing protein [Streptomyces sp. TRM64462]
MTVPVSDHDLVSSPGSLITRDGQIQWAGLLLGPGTPYGVDRQGLTGWADLPGLDSGDAARPTGHGSWPGARWSQPRTVTAGVWLLPGASADAAHELLDAFVRATPVEDGEQWLAVRLHGRTTGVRARVTQRAVPTDRQFATGGVTRATVQWVATDPRRYALREEVLSLSLPQYGSGLTYPLGYPLDYGTPAATGSAAAVNSGSAATCPQVVFTGPVTRPRLVNHATGRALEYDLALAAGDRLTVDTQEGTVLLGDRASRLYTAAPGSSPEQAFVLRPGENRLEFRAADGTPAASARLTWRSAYL